MGIVTSGNKWNATKAVINTWLQDQKMYCNNCGEDYNPAIHLYESCCEEPAFGRNIDHCKGVIEQNKRSKEGLFKDTASSDKATMRYAISLPERLLSDLEEYFRKHGEKLFNNSGELHSFMKEFPMFAVPRRV